MFGFVNTKMSKELSEVNFRKEKQKKDKIFKIVFGIVGFIILNVILYLISRF